MFENFNPQDDKDLERLFSYLDKEKFNSLSLSDQNEVIDTLINISDTSNNPDSNVKTIGMVKGSNGLQNFNIQHIIDTMGYEPFREMMRKAISEGGLSMNSIPASEVQDLCEKLKNGNITEEEQEKLDMIMHSKFAHNDHEDVQFSTYTILHLYSGLLDKAFEDKDITLLRDAEPFINSAYITLLASLISKPDNPIGKMFDKHGFGKVQMAITDLTVKFSNLIIDYSKENCIAPERTLIALMNVIKILAGPLDTSLDAYPEDMLEDILSHVLTAVYDIDSPESLDELRKGSKDDKKTNVSTNKSANADKKESQSDDDIRKLLLDD